MNVHTSVWCAIRSYSLHNIALWFIKLASIRVNHIWFKWQLCYFLCDFDWVAVLHFKVVLRMAWNNICYKLYQGQCGGKEPAHQCRRLKRHGFDPWVREIFWRRKWQPTPIFFPGESHGQRSLVGYSPKGCKELAITEAT